MADKVDKPKKKAKGKKEEKGVLSALPSTRPERIGGRRAAAQRPAPAASASAKRTSAAKSAGRAPSKPAARSTTTTSARARPATRRKAAAPRTFEPTEAAEAAAAATGDRTAGAIPLSESRRERSGDGTDPRPRPVREGAPGIGTGYRDRPDEESGRPTGVELATTAVRAAGEVAQLGLTIGGHVLKRVVERLPKP